MRHDRGRKEGAYLKNHKVGAPGRKTSQNFGNCSDYSNPDVLSQHWKEN